MTPIAATNAIVIRHATDADICALAELSILDSRPPLTGPALIAELDGIARAALALRDGNVAADPFVPTADLVELLRTHARSIMPKPSVREAVCDRLGTLVRVPGTAAAPRAGA
jgi:hypothetical protein